MSLQYQDNLLNWKSESCNDFIQASIHRTQTSIESVTRAMHSPTSTTLSKLCSVCQIEVAFGNAFSGGVHEVIMVVPVASYHCVLTICRVIIACGRGLNQELYYVDLIRAGSRYQINSRIEEKKIIKISRQRSVKHPSSTYIYQLFNQP